MDIISLDDNTWRFTDGDVSFFLLRGKERAVFIDGGWRKSDLHSLALHFTDLNLSLLNTSCSSSLIGSNDEFSRFYMSPGDAFIYYGFMKRVGIVKPVSDGSVIDLGERKLEVISFPGITPGAVVILDHYSGALFSGLSISDGITDLSLDYSDVRAYLMSVRRMDDYRGKYDVIYSSVGRGEVGPAILTHLEDTARGIIRGGIEGRSERGYTDYSDGFVTIRMKEAQV